MRVSCSEEESFAEFAEYAMHDLAKAGPSDDIKSKDDDLGGFKKANVSILGIFMGFSGSNMPIYICFQ